MSVYLISSFSSQKICSDGLEEAFSIVTYGLSFGSVGSLLNFEVKDVYCMGLERE